MMAPEGRKILPHLTVLENLMLGLQQKRPESNSQGPWNGSMNSSKTQGACLAEGRHPLGGDSRCWLWAGP
jgi:hypothetical protein